MTVLQPTGDNVLVYRKNEQVRETDFGLVLIQTLQKSILTAEVVAVGPGNRSANGEFYGSELSVGDTVYYSAYVTETEVGEDLYLVPEAQILAKVAT